MKTTKPRCIVPKCKRSALTGLRYCAWCRDDKLAAMRCERPTVKTVDGRRVDVPVAESRMGVILDKIFGES